MYELGTALASVDDSTGAASLWMVAMFIMGEAAASAGSSDMVEYLMMGAGSHCETCATERWRGTKTQRRAQEMRGVWCGEMGEWRREGDG